MVAPPMTNSEPLLTASRHKPRSSVGSPTDSISSTSPRRIPHCKTCHRPRQGHPRTGCPYAEPTVHQTNGDTDDAFVDELSSLHIVNPNENLDSPSLSTETPTNSNNRKRRLSVRFALLPPGSLSSLSTTSSEIVEKLLQPGMMNSMSDTEDQTAVLQWRTTLTGPSEVSPEAPELRDKAEQVISHSSLSRRMPGTLNTPTASFVSTEPLSSQHTIDHVDMNKSVSRKSQSLARTMSADERSLFLDNLTQSSGAAPAMLFSVPLVDFKTVQRDAEKLGFTVRVLPNGSSQEHRWIILAKEMAAAEFLEKRLTEEEEKERKAKGTAGHLSAAAGGALVGAVATFTGLAFA